MRLSFSFERHKYRCDKYVLCERFQMISFESKLASQFKLHDPQKKIIYLRDYSTSRLYMSPVTVVPSAWIVDCDHVCSDFEITFEFGFGFK